MSNIINLLSCPRNLSTAIMYSFASRSDCKVIDEPFYAYYLNKTSKKHPMYEQILRAQSSNVDDVLDEIYALAQTNTYVFLKNMCHHQPDDLRYLSDCKNIIYLRRPEQVAQSFKKIIKDATDEDLGYQKQFELFTHLKQIQHQPVVFDSIYLQLDAQKALKSLCDALSIPFDLNMLTWSRGGIPEDGVWAEVWYHNVHKTTGFEKRIEALPVLPIGTNEYEENYLTMLQDMITVI